MVVGGKDLQRGDLQDLRLGYTDSLGNSSGWLGKSPLLSSGMGWCLRFMEKSECIGSKWTDSSPKENFTKLQSILDIPASNSISLVLPFSDGAAISYEMFDILPLACLSLVTSAQLEEMKRLFEYQRISKHGKYLAVVCYTDSKGRASRYWVLRFELKKLASSPYWMDNGHQEVRFSQLPLSTSMSLIYNTSPPLSSGRL